MSNFLRNLVRAFAAVVSIAFLVLPVRAQSYTWTGGGGTNFNNSGDWNPGTPLAGTDSLFFGANSAGSNSLSDDLMTPASYTLTTLTFTTGAPAYTINPAALGNGFTLTGNITNVSGLVETINDQIVLSGTTTINSGTITGGASNSIILGGVISGNAPLTKNGEGSVILTAANTYSGETLLTNTSGGSTSSTGGTLQIGNGTSGSAANTSSYNIQYASTLAFDEVNGSTITQNIAVGGAATQLQGNEIAGNTNTLSGVIAGTTNSGGFTQTGAGTTILTGANSYTNATLVSAGALLVDNTSGSGTGTSAVSVLGSSASAQATLGGSGTITPGGSRTVALKAYSILAPGVGTTIPITLTISGSKTSATNVLTFAGNTGTGGTNNSPSLTFNLYSGNQSDEINVTGGVSYYGANLSVGVGNAINFVDETGGNLSGAYTLITQVSEVGLTFGGTGIGGNETITGGLLDGLTGYTSDLEYNTTTNTVLLEVESVTVPEPSTWAMLFGGLALLFFWQRRGWSLQVKK